jgi:hypothetical protein
MEKLLMVLKLGYMVAGFAILAAGAVLWFFWRRR